MTTSVTNTSTCSEESSSVSSACSAFSASSTVSPCRRNAREAKARDAYYAFAEDEPDDDAPQAAKDTWQSKLNDLRSAWMELRSKVPEESTTHGFVWLFLAKPAAEAPSVAQPAADDRR